MKDASEMEERLPIIEVNGENFVQVWPSLAQAISGATFIAIDCELSGLGTRSKLNSSALDDRYRNLVELAQSYAVIALGISCFSCNSVSNISVHNEKGREQIRSHDYLVQTFNVLTLCSDPFMVECKSLMFLHNHGFDFNKLYSKGILYYKGCDRQKDEALSVRHLFSKIVAMRKPVVIHNGLIDLAFLYQSFYCDLPRKNDIFAADLDDLFPHGVYDTKYLAEFHQSLPATYLEYLFKKMQLRNASRQKNGEWHVRLRFPPYPKLAPSIDWHPYLQILSYRLEDDTDHRELCQCFAFHGYCNKSGQCSFNHDINRAVKMIQKTGAKKRGNSKYSGPRGCSVARIIEQITKADRGESPEGGKRSKCDSMDNPKPKKKCDNSEMVNGNDHDNKKMVNVNSTKKTEAGVADQSESNIRGTSGHRAGYDAFMTGFVFASIVSQKGLWTSKEDPFSPANIGLKDEVNKIYLMGKDIPFLIRTGMYANKSSKHCSKIEKLRLVVGGT